MIQESKNIFSTTRSLRSLGVFFNFLKDTNPPILELSLVYIFIFKVINKTYINYINLYLNIINLVKSIIF